MADDKPQATRREFLKDGVRAAGFLALGSAVGWTAAGEAKERTVWQIDPYKCSQCGKCATNCVLTPSAVKCVHAYDVCGYCDVCGGYKAADAIAHNDAAENQLCPTGAIQRSYIEDPFYEYVISEDLCIGCAKCVKGCFAYGNGSLYLQIKHDRCVNCNDCGIARACPAQAISRVPASKPYILKTRPGKE